MKKNLLLFLLLALCSVAGAQELKSDSLLRTDVVVIRDPRLDLLEKKEYELNVLSMKSAKGYRLLVMSSSDRAKVMSTRAKLLQQFPEQKVYMAFQAPNIKLKFGNFTDKSEAEHYRDLISSQKITTNNVYVVPDIVEVKPDKLKDKDEQ
jgi:hypothetical protein